MFWYLATGVTLPDNGVDEAGFVGAVIVAFGGVASVVFGGYLSYLIVRRTMAYASSSLGGPVVERSLSAREYSRVFDRWNGLNGYCVRCEWPEDACICDDDCPKCGESRGYYCTCEGSFPKGGESVGFRSFMSYEYDRDYDWSGMVRQYQERNGLLDDSLWDSSDDDWADFVRLNGMEDQDCPRCGYEMLECACAADISDFEGGDEFLASRRSR